MRIKRIKLYKYEELSPEAQAKARDWFREASAGDNYFSECIVDDFKDILKACGFELSQRHGHDTLQWSGFCSQGDGAAFGASWRASLVDVAAMLKDRPADYTDRDGKVQHCKGNAELRVILEAFASLAADEPTGYGSTEASHRGNYQEDSVYSSRRAEAIYRGTFQEDLADQFKELCSDLAHYFYRSLEREYEYMMSDETVAETIEANEYEFTAEGQRA